ncbi:MAG: hypothetical protein Q9166_003585 [cf. Caloplaca sp. 2 TL-2023]
MVSTRGQRVSSAGIDPALAIGTATAEPIAPLVTTLSGDAPVERVATNTRSRKRHRSGSPFLDNESERNSKRLNVGKPQSPIAKRTNNAATPAPVGNGNTVAQPSPDMHDVMSRIIDHGETVDSQYAATPDPEGIVPQGASLQLKVQSLPILDNLAIQILTTFAKSSYQEVLAITSDTESEPGAAYSLLKSLFDHTKKVYSTRSPFLSPHNLGLDGREQTETIRKANLATFVASVFGSQDVGFYDLNECFLDAFLADGGRLLKVQAGLFLDLKTQAYISAIANGQRPREDILQDLFPDDMEQRLLSRRSGPRQLSPGEADFIQRASNRKKTLLEEPLTMESIAQLPEKYAWDEFLRDISSYVSKNFASSVGSSERKTPGQTRSTNYFETGQPQQSKRQALRKPQQAQLPQEVDIPPPTTTTNTFARVAQMVPPATDDIAEKAARAAQFAMQDFSVDHEPAGPSQRNDQNQEQQQQQTQQYPFQFEQQTAPYFTHPTQINNSQQHPQLEQQQQQPGDMAQAQGVFTRSDVPFPTQSAPTSVLYERARLAATAKASPSNRRAGHPSQRRPWSQEEENSLMSGLDQVKGPHWSQILALYGPGGTHNETLKDRNQVQLKDKARNLKLFFLKSGIEVPYYLQFVTGELKTRAPQAAKQEAQQRERAARQEEEAVATSELEGSTQLDGAQTVDTTMGEQGEQDASMEDGEGEVIDPAEYAAVHGAGSHIGGAIQINHGLN